METQIASISLDLLTRNGTYKAILKPFLNSLPDYSWTSIQAGFNGLKSTRKPSSLRVLKSALKDTLKRTITDRRELSLLDDYFRALKVPTPDKAVHKEKVLSQSEADQLIDSARTPRIRTLSQFLIKTGLRISEALSVRLDNCEARDNFVFIRIIGKRSKERRVFVPGSLYSEIRTAYPGQVFLFEGQAGRAISRFYAYRAIKRLGKRINRVIHPHTLRHTFATNTYSKTKNLKGVSSYLGHANTAITATLYVHSELTPDDLFGL